MIPKREPPNPHVVNKFLAKVKMEDCIKTIISQLYTEYQKYLPINASVSSNLTEQRTQNARVRSFNEYLQSNGSYQKCQTALFKDALLYVQQHFNVEYLTNSSDSNYTASDHEIMMSKIYVHLVNMVNKILNGPITCGLDISQAKLPDNTLSDHWRRISEANELGASSLSLRYVNEIVAAKPRDPDVWLLLSVYHLGYVILRNIFN